MTALTETIRLGEILHRAKEDPWSGPIPIVDARIRIAIDSLRRHDRQFWEKDASMLYKLLESNPGVKKIFSENKPETIAFAIRDARL